MNKNFKQRKKLGLALGSGGWRGQAHVGVIKALINAGIRIDYIAGASSGALVGGAYCALKDITILEEIFREKINKKSLLWAFSDPKISSGMFKGEKIMEIFEEFVGKFEIEALSIPFCAVCSDLLSGEIVEIKEGSLTTAVRASASVPFVFEPVKYKNYRLIDGGTAAPIPVSSVKQMGADVVIAVNLYRNIFPIKAKKMNALESVLKTSQVMLHHLAKYSSQMADLIIEPDIKENKIYTDPFTRFAKNEGVIEAGEKVVAENIEAIKKLLS